MLTSKSYLKIIIIIMI